MRAWEFRREIRFHPFGARRAASRRIPTQNHRSQKTERISTRFPGATHRRLCDNRTAAAITSRQLSTRGRARMITRSCRMESIRMATSRAAQIRARRLRRSAEVSGFYRVEVFRLSWSCWSWNSRKLRRLASAKVSPTSRHRRLHFPTHLRSR